MSQPASPPTPPLPRNIRKARNIIPGLLLRSHSPIAKQVCLNVKARGLALGFRVVLEHMSLRDASRPSGAIPRDNKSFRVGFTVQSGQANGMTKLDRYSAEKMLRIVRPYLHNLPMSPDTTEVRMRNVPFYGTFRLYSFTDRSTHPAQTHFALYKPGHLHVFDPSHKSIYEANSNAPLRLTRENVMEYVRFFFTLARQKIENIHLVEKLDDIPFTGLPTEETAEELGQLVQPLLHAPQTENHPYELMATVMFRDALFSATIGVDEKGIVKVSDHTLLADALPAHADAAHQVQGWHEAGMMQAAAQSGF